ncbi:MAG: IS3 family transposase, partial [Thermoprotei archaeon]
LKRAEVRISMDGRGRAFDNIFVERFWRSLKYEEVYLHAYCDGREAYEGIKRFTERYCFARPHQALGYQTPHEVYRLVD